MDRMNSYAVEEEVIAALPLCVRRLRGPGRARRLPPNAAYRSAGAVLRRVLIYSEDGQARVQVVRSDGLGPAKESASSQSRPSSTSPPLPSSNAAPTGAGGGGPAGGNAKTLSVAPPSMSPPGTQPSSGLLRETQEEGSGGEGRTMHISSQEAAAVHTRNQLRRERAATLAADTERRYEEAQESTLAGLLHALPLLRVLPPLSLQQQVYTRAAPPPTPTHMSSNNDTNNARTAQLTTCSDARLQGGSSRDDGAAGSLTFPSVPGSVASSGKRTGNSSGTSHLSLAALRIVQARYSAVLNGSSNSGGSGADGGGARRQSNQVIRDLRGMGLSSAVLLSKEEMAAREAQLQEEPSNTDATAAQAVESAEETGAAALSMDSSVAPSVSPPSPTPPTPPPSTSALQSEAALLFPPSVTEEHTEEASADATDTTSASLNGIFIDGGLTVTIKLGASCDEPNSLRCVAWGGCRPVVLRAVVWRLLSDFAAVQVARQRSELQRKRQQYEGYTRQYCSALTMLAVSEAASATSPTAASPTQQIGNNHNNSSATQPLGGGGSSGTGVLRDSASLSRLPALSKSNTNPLSPNAYAGGGLGGSMRGGASMAAASSLAPHERAIIHQMLLDLPRHRSPVFHARRSVAGMARCLFLWSQRHPAVGYVQGMDDVVAIFYQVFLTDALRQHARERQQQQHRELVYPASSPSGAYAPSDLAGSANRFRDDGSISGVYGPSSVGEEAMDGDSERSTRDIVRLLLLSVKSHRPAALSLSAGSAPSTPTASTAAAAAAAVPPATDATNTVITTTPLGPSGESETSAALLFSPFLTEADVDVVFRTPAALDAALSELPESYLTQVEADTFFCAGRVLSFLQDNFMPGQPGILRSVRRLEALVRKVDPAVVAFLDDYGLTVMDGCFQWLHCLLARELPLSLLLRLWDCYLAIGVGGDRPPGGSAFGGLPSSVVGSSSGGGAGASTSSDEAIMYFHVCVCCALLRALRTSLTGSAAATTMGPTAAAASPPSAPTSTVGGWAAALVTALPGFRTRTSLNGSGSTSSSGGGSASRPTLSIDVVMSAMKKPFETLFPNYPSTETRQRRMDAERARQQDAATTNNCNNSNSCGRGSSARPSPSPPEESAEEAAAEQWLDLLIADAYCIWRLHPLGS